MSEEEATLLMQRKQLLAYAIEGAPVGPVLLAGRSRSPTSGVEAAGQAGPAAGGSARYQVVKHRVDPGETLWSIARKYGTTPQSIAQSNRMAETAVLQPGQTLQVPTFEGIVHNLRAGETVSELAERYKVKPEKILEASGVSRPELLQIGFPLKIPGATIPKVQVASVTGSSAGDRRSQRGGRVTAASRRVEGLIRPVSGGITSPFGRRWGRLHAGVDFGGAYGTPFRAAAAGTVAFAGWDSAYGRKIVIDHGNGVQTWYAHASKLLVRQGEHVEQGQEIGAIGASGRATGPHLHFELHVNGRPINPAASLP